MIVIHAPSFEIRSDKARLSAAIEHTSCTNNLWFEVDDKYADFIANDRLDAFVVACLFPALVAGDDIVAKGTLSPKLYYHINHNLIPILQLYLGVPKRISLFAEKLMPMDSTPGCEVITGFSGGIDSFCNYYDHSGDRAPDGWRITYFIYNNVGSHGQSSKDKDEATFRKRYECLKAFVDEAGIEMLAVNSNLDEIVNLPFQKTHTLRNGAIALLLQRRASKFLYASGVSYAHTKIAQTDDTTYLDPVILPMLGTERLECVPSGGQHTRVDKTRMISVVPASHALLDVCVMPEKAPQGMINCSSCWKCLRTGITLAALGQLQAYDKVFDIGMIRRFEPIFLLEALSTDNPLQHEVLSLIQETGYPISPRIRFLSLLLPKVVLRRLVVQVWQLMINRPRVAILVGRFLGARTHG